MTSLWQESIPIKIVLNEIDICDKSLKIHDYYVNFVWSKNPNKINPKNVKKFSMLEYLLLF
jgi:hypothetical protein